MSVAGCVIARPSPSAPYGSTPVALRCCRRSAYLQEKLELFCEPHETLCQDSCGLPIRSSDLYSLNSPWPCLWHHSSVCGSVARYSSGHTWVGGLGWGLEGLWQSQQWIGRLTSRCLCHGGELMITAVACPAVMISEARSDKSGHALPNPFLQPPSCDTEGAHSELDG